MIDFMPLQKLPEIEGNLGKIILATGFEKMPKPQPHLNKMQSAEDCTV